MNIKHTFSVINIDFQFQIRRITSSPLPISKEVHFQIGKAEKIRNYL